MNFEEKISFRQQSSFNKNSRVPMGAQRKRIQLGTMRLQVQSQALLHGLRIWGCCELWFRSQKWLRSCTAVAVAGSCSSNSTLSLGTSICCRCGPKKQKKQKKSSSVLCNVLLLCLENKCNHFGPVSSPIKISDTLTFIRFGLTGSVMNGLWLGLWRKQFGKLFRIGNHVPKAASRCPPWIEETCSYLLSRTFAEQLLFEEIHFPLVNID